MKNDLTCGVVRDLLPSYVENLLGEESREAVDRHLETCAECTARKDAMSAPAAEACLLEREGRLDLLRQVHRLPEPQREVVYLRAFGGLSFREIGDVCGKTENWARVTIYRSKEKLRNGGCGDEK